MLVAAGQATLQPLSRAKEQHAYVIARCSELRGHIFAWNFVDQAQVYDSSLHFVQGDEAP